MGSFLSNSNQNTHVNTDRTAKLKMSYCKEEGKDKIIFISEEDAKQKSSIEFSKPEEEPTSLVQKDGSINWGCPCIGSMAIGPCGVEFREAFSCFHYSEAEPKGSDCFEKFSDMNECMSKYPELYENNDEALNEAAQESVKTTNNEKEEQKEEAKS